MENVIAQVWHKLKGKSSVCECCSAPEMAAFAALVQSSSVHCKRELCQQMQPMSLSQILPVGKCRMYQEVHSEFRSRPVVTEALVSFMCFDLSLKVPWPWCKSLARLFPDSTH